MKMKLQNIIKYNLGVCYELGIGVEKDENKAFDFYQKSAENGCINAIFQLGYCYVNGIGIEVNKDKGFELYNEAAGKKDELQYEIDERVNDLNKIKYWFQKAAKGDNKVALYKLGEFYELKDSILEDEAMAFEFYKKSADQGFIDAQYKLGYCYNNGIGVNINIDKAFDLYKIAAEGGNINAQKILALLCEAFENGC